MKQVTPNPNTSILLVDDHPANLLALRTILDSLSVTICEAHSGKEAIQKTSETEFAVVLLDVQMPGLNGFETAKRLRSQSKSQHTPIIFLTAYEMEEFPVEQAYLLGAVDYLVKPLIPVVLQAKVRGFIELFELKQSAKQEAEQLRMLVHGTTEYAIFLMDTTGHIITWNPGAERLKGYRSDEIIGQHFSRFYPSEALERQWPQEELSRALSEGRLEDEGWRLRKDGSKFWANVVITALYDESGIHRGFSKITRDLTERKLAEENTRQLIREEATRLAVEANARLLQEQHERLQVTLASIGDGVISVDTNGVVTFLNPVAEKLTGWSQDQAVGKYLEQVFQIVEEQTQRLLENPAIRALREGQVVNIAEHTLLRSLDGTERLIDDSAAPIRDGAGIIIGVILIFRDITEKQQAEIQIRESEARKTAILDTALDCVISMDHEGKIIEFNPAAEKTFGYSHEQVIGRDLADLLVPDWSQEPNSSGMTLFPYTVQPAILNKRLELFGFRADRTEFPVEIAITQTSIKGRPLFTAYLRDISERKRVETRREVRNLINHIVALSETLKDAAKGVLRVVCENLEWEVGLVWMLDQKHQTLRYLESWNSLDRENTEIELISREKTFQKGEGLPGRVWVSKTATWVVDVTQDPNFPRSLAAIQDCLHSAVCCPILVAGNTVGVIEFFTQGFRELDRDLMELIDTIANQIGQFLERHRSEQSLKESEQRFARFMHQFPGLAWIKDIEGRYIYVNDSAERAFRYPKTELYGKTDEEIFDPNTAAIFRHNDRVAIQRGIGIQVIETMEDEHGIVRHSLVSKFPIMEIDGKVVMVGGMAIDITDRLKAEEALRQADRKKNEFLATLAHELRNPLAPIRNSLQILKLPRVDSVTAQQTREMIERQVHHLIRLVDDLLDVSRVMQGKVELRKEFVEFASIVARAVETAKPLIDAHGHTLAIDIPEESLLLEADPIRLAQVVSNLLTNAAKYSEDHGRIALVVQRIDREVVLQVKDTGIGIASGMLNQIFELFVQANPATTRSQGGLGIGLTLVRNLVEMHRGSVEAKSEGLGKGSTFIVRLPLLPEPMEAEPSSTLREPVDHSMAVRRLLIVDDNRDAANSLAILLELLGHEVQVVYDGYSALELVERYRPELIFLDIGMPEMDGYEVARRLRQLPTLKEVVLVALTGWGQPEDRRLAQEAGFNHHLVKPAEPKSIQDLLESLSPN